MVELSLTLGHAIAQMTAMESPGNNLVIATLCVQGYRLPVTAAVHILPPTQPPFTAVRLLTSVSSPAQHARLSAMQGMLAADWAASNVMLTVAVKEG